MSLPPVAPPVALTLGDPAGIGPEVVAKCWDNRAAFALPPFVAVGDARSLRRKIDPHTEEPVIQTKRGFGYMLKVGKTA